MRLLIDLQQVVVVLADDLDHEVEGARGDDHVVDLGHGGQRVGDGLEVALDVDADHRLAPEAHGERVGDGDDLHHALVEQLLDALAHGRLGEADGLADRGVRPAAVLLELLDDREGDGVERRVPIRLAGSWSLRFDWPRRSLCTTTRLSGKPRIDEIRCLSGSNLTESEVAAGRGC